MARVFVEMKVMPDDVNRDLELLGQIVTVAIRSCDGEVHATETQNVAFGLKALIVKFSMPEQGGGTQAVEDAVAAVEGVSSVEITSVRRSIG